ncbi:hypothetical protein EKM05_14185 [Flavobacterium sp. GSP27]|uniref:hypothetical protein n=1 Tax=unclassified Flavobacterium TaxID=196869 RepID=UPI000F84D568|nr:MULTISPECIES: hypothetical protein [unclassified Flavobacterium]RTY84645.1 hypothetical protein EKL99_01220 [Flavobacterium sp. ZB4P23]RTY91981.1 hypothetical protein EKM01_04995 [Flavobacterium sp. RSP46]RTY94150.1 hypothetical protein EKL32_13380 [Flavobacterium sp. GSN2]RTZ04677.1 hypothetical protein EKM05_14185 [Flavobacterium sp. GSP27]
MMKKKLLVLLFGFGTATYAQVGVGTLAPNASTMLDVVANNKGVMISRVPLKGTNDSTTISNGNVESLLVYNTQLIADVKPGYYYWLNNKWNRIVNTDDVTKALSISSIVTKTSSYDALTTDETILVDATSNAVTVTLPSAVLSLGKKFNIKKIDTSNNNVIIKSAAGAIDTMTSISGGLWLQTWVLQSDGTNWFVISSN